MLVLNREMRKIFIIAIIFFIFAVAASAQDSITVTTRDCPPDRVCISRAAAEKALVDADRVKALEIEGKEKDRALADMRDLLNKSRIEFAAVSGENTALRQNAVQDRAIIEILLKSVRPKKIGLINLF